MICQPICCYFGTPPAVAQSLVNPVRDVVSVLSVVEIRSERFVIESRSERFEYLAQNTSSHL